MLGKHASSLQFVSLRLTEHVSQHCRLKSLGSREDKIAERTAIYILTICNVIIVLYSMSFEIYYKGTHSCPPTVI
jgi:hypothetical protein